MGGGARNMKSMHPGMGGEKHEIYASAFGGHLFYHLFSQGRGAWPPALPGSTTEFGHKEF